MQINALNHPKERATHRSSLDEDDSEHQHDDVEHQVQGSEAPFEHLAHTFRLGAIELLVVVYGPVRGGGAVRMIGCGGREGTHQNTTMMLKALKKRRAHTRFRTKAVWSLRLTRR